MDAWLPLSLAVLTTLAIVAAVLWPAWWPTVRAWRAASAERQATTTRFVDAVEHGDFDAADDAVARLFDRSAQ
jgi:hypothetical protein